MKNRIIVLAILFIIFSCAVKKQTVEYDIPEAMLPEVKVEYIKMCDKGQLLYNGNCGRCHNVTVKRKEFVPDFDSDKLSGYVLLSINEQHESVLPDSVMTTDELSSIVTFLTYKKKNGIQNKLISTESLK